MATDQEIMDAFAKNAADILRLEQENARLREALAEIAASCDRHPLSVGFVHGEPTRKELQERLDVIKAIATQAALQGGGSR